MATTIGRSAASSPAASRRTTVICLRGRDRATLLADPDFVYVAWAVHIHGWAGSLWGLAMAGADAAGRAEAARRFEREIAGDSARARFLRSRLGELRGKVLGCWCCDWDGHGAPARPCHAVILARMADGVTDGPLAANG